MRREAISRRSCVSTAIAGSRTDNRRSGWVTYSAAVAADLA